MSTVHFSTRKGVRLLYGSTSPFSQYTKEWSSFISKVQFSQCIKEWGSSILKVFGVFSKHKGVELLYIKSSKEK